MELFLLSVLASLVPSLIIAFSNPLHGRYTNDIDLTSIQKFHIHPVPRIGGLSLVIGVFVVYLFSKWMNSAELEGIGGMLFAGLPIFLVGLLEDVTKKISARIRLYVSFISAGLVYFLLHANFIRIDWVWFDTTFLVLPAISFIMTLFVVAGTIHAMNLIDGFNGLMLGTSMLMFGAIAVVSHNVNDAYVFNLAIACLGLIGGLFIVNFPLGKIFTGDGGAYFIGFLLSTCVLLLVQRNPEVSAWFPCLLLIYPIFETLFSMYRKVLLRKMAAMQPDGIHLHMLVYKRIVRHKPLIKENWANSMTSPYLWVLSLLGIIPAVLFWNNTLLIIFFCLFFSLVYLRIYWQMVLFKNSVDIFRINNLISREKELTKELT